MYFYFRMNEKKGLAAALFYMVLSPSMAFLNKAVLSSYKFSFPFTIMAVQMLITIIFLEIFRYFKLINIPAYSLQKGNLFLWPSMFYAATSVSSLVMLNAMNIPMYGTIKRCGPLVTLFFSIFLLKKPVPSTSIIFSVLLISLGAVIAGIGDMSIDGWTYICGTISVVCQASYLTLTQKSTENNLSSVQMLQLNSYNTFPVFFICAITLHEASMIEKHLYSQSIGFYITFTVVVCSGAIMNYSLFLCTALNSALTTSLVGVIKSVLQTAIGFFTFGGVELQLLNTTGIFMNLSGGAIYTYAKYKEKIHKHKMNIVNDNNNLHFKEVHTINIDPKATS